MSRAPSRRGHLALLAAIAAFAVLAVLAIGGASTTAAANGGGARIGKHDHRHGNGHRGHGPRRGPSKGPALPRPGGPAFGAVTAVLDGPGHRLVTVGTSGPQMTEVQICDLSTPECVPAELVAGNWVARIPAPDPELFSIGMIGRSGGDWAFGNSSSNPPAPVPPLVNIG